MKTARKNQPSAMVKLNRATAHAAVKRRAVQRLCFCLNTSRSDTAYCILHSFEQFFLFSCYFKHLRIFTFLRFFNVAVFVFTCTVFFRLKRLLNIVSTKQRRNKQKKNQFQPTNKTLSANNFMWIRFYSASFFYSRFSFLLCSPLQMLNLSSTIFLYFSLVWINFLCAFVFSFASLGLA